MKSSIRSRSFQLLGLAAQLTKKEFTHSIKEHLTRGVDEIASGRLKMRLEQAKLISENLSQLKGAAMKAGQLLSLDASDYFPPEAVEMLSKLQGKATPVEWQELRSSVVEELSQEKFSEFENFSTIPAASASIGQVHRAKLNGIDVAIKVQYPGIAESIDSDLAILRTLAQSLIAITGRKIDLKETFAELSSVLHQEADYLQEAAHMSEYRALLNSTSNHDGKSSFVVPEPIATHSTKKVLTMTWQQGETLNDWLKRKPSIEEREQVARLLLDLYVREFYEWGLVQTDPNYGNFLIQTDPLKLVVLDFGATLRYPVEFRTQYVNLLRLMAEGDHARTIQALVDFELLDPRESAESNELLAAMLALSLEPFSDASQPFRFKNEDYTQRSRVAVQNFTRSLKYSPPPRSILFLHRKLGGVFTFLKNLDVVIDVRPYWNRILATEAR